MTFCACHDCKPARVISSRVAELGSNGVAARVAASVPSFPEELTSRPVSETNSCRAITSLSGGVVVSRGSASC